MPKSDVPGEQAWPTQAFPTAPPPFARQRFTEADINPFLPESEKARLRTLLRGYRNEGLFTPPSLQGTVQMPGNNGGANWGSSGVDPLRGNMFIVWKELPMIIKLNPPARARVEWARAGVERPRPKARAVRRQTGKAKPRPNRP